eukprot:2742595-Amphidinium_carterae.2
MVRMVIKLPKAQGWDAEALRASAVADLLRRKVADHCFSEILVRADQTATFLCRRENCWDLCKASGLSGAFIKVHESERSHFEMLLLWLPEGSSLEQACGLAQDPRCFGVVQKGRATVPRYALRFRSAEDHTAFSNEHSLPDVESMGRWKLSGLQPETGLQGLLELLSDLQWEVFDVLYFGGEQANHHAVFLATAMGNAEPAKYKADRQWRQLRFKALNAKAQQQRRDQAQQQQPQQPPQQPQQQPTASTTAMAERQRFIASTAENRSRQRASAKAKAGMQPPPAVTANVGLPNTTQGGGERQQRQDLRELGTPPHGRAEQHKDTQARPRMPSDREWMTVSHLRRAIIEAWLRRYLGNKQMHITVGNLHMLSANISSWNTKREWCLQQTASICFFQECRVRDTKTVVAAAKAAGWRAIVSVTDSTDIAAGLIVLHRAPLRAHLLWHHAGRMQLLALRMGHVTTLVLHVYGHATDLAATQETLQIGMAEMRARGGDPGMIVGDLNGAPEDFEELAVLAERGWQRLHPDTTPTCYAPGSPGTAIDVVLCSPALLGLVRGPRVLDDETIVKPHRPLAWQVCVETKLRAEQLMRRRPMQTAVVHPHVCADVEEQVRQALTLDGAWECWSKAAVAYYGGDETVADTRSTPVDTQHKALPIYTAREIGTAGGSHELVRLQRLVGVLRSLQSAKAADHTQQTERMLQCLRRRQLLGRPTFWSELEALCLRAETKFKASDRALREQRTQSYQAWRERTHPCRAMATCAKGMAPVETQGWEYQGRVVTDPAEMMSTLKEAWESEWCVPRHVDPQTFMHRFPSAQHAPRALPPLDLALLETGLQALAAHKKPGPDGWSRDMLCGLSLPLKHALIHVLRRCELEGAFPRALSTSQVVYLEKPGKRASPLTVRPICLMSEVYKLWTKMRLPEVYQVLNHNCSGNIVGGKPGVRIQRLVADTMMQLDTLQATGEP